MSRDKKHIGFGLSVVRHLRVEPVNGIFGLQLDQLPEVSYSPSYFFRHVRLFEGAESETAYLAHGERLQYLEVRHYEINFAVDVFAVLLRSAESTPPKEGFLRIGS